MIEQRLVDAILRRASLGENDVAFLTGSIAEGDGNRGSDIDICVLLEKPLDRDMVGGYCVAGSGTRIKIDYFNIASTGVEIQYWLKCDLQEVCDQLERFTIKPLQEIWPNQLRLVHRLKAGKCLRNPEEFERLRGLCDFDALSRYLCFANHRAVDAYYHDANCFLDEGHAGDALVVAQLAVSHAVDAYLATRGETNLNTKWRYRRLNAIEPGSPIGALYLDCIGGSPAGCPNPEARAAMCLSLAETLSAAMHLGFDAGSLYAGVLAPTQPSLGECPRRQRNYRLRKHLNEEITISRWEHEDIAFNDVSGVIWCLCDGIHDPAAMAHVLSGLFSIGQDEAAKTIASFLPDMRRHGLIDYVR